MNRTLTLLILILLIFASPAFGKSTISYPDSIQTDHLRKIQILLFNDDFDSALILSQTLIEKYPDDPAGYFGAGISVLARMCDAEDDSEADYCLALLDTVQILAVNKKPVKDSSHASWMKFFQANAISYRSVFKARFGSITGAIKDAMKARSEFENGLQFDSSNLDLYLGLGLYHFWKSTKAGLLRTIGIFRNEIDKGIEEIYRAVRYSILSRESARNALIWVWLEQKQFDSTIAMCHEMQTNYPEGKSFLWPMAEAFESKNQTDSALMVLENLRSKLTASPGNYYNLIECDYKIIKLLKDSRLGHAVQMAAARSMTYFDNIPEASRKKQKSKISFIRKQSGR